MPIGQLPDIILKFLNLSSMGITWLGYFAVAVRFNLSPGQMPSGSCQISCRLWADANRAAAKNNFGHRQMPSGICQAQCDCDRQLPVGILPGIWPLLGFFCPWVFSLIRSPWMAAWSDTLLCDPHKPSYKKNAYWWKSCSNHILKKIAKNFLFTMYIHTKKDNMTQC